MSILKKIGKSLLIGTIMGVGVAIITKTFVSDLIDRLENQSYYMRYYWKYKELNNKKKEKQEQIQETGIYIIDIDDRSQHKMGVYWNWNRSYHAQLLNNLKKHFPAAIIFDINFMDPEDQNIKNSVDKLIVRAQSLDPSINIPHKTKESILNSLDYDRQFVEATKNCAVVYQSVRLSSERDYSDIGLSQILKRATLAWHDSLGPQSCLTLPVDLRKTITNDKTIIDGIFSPLAQAAKGIGHINMDPNDDGVIREVNLLYGFGSHPPVYLPISLKAVIDLFGTPMNEIIYSPKHFIDIGKPFKIFKDSIGSLSFSYPQVTELQIKAILRHAQHILSLQPGKKISITTKLSIGKDSAGSSYLSSYYGQMPQSVVNAFASYRDSELIGMPKGSTIAIENTVQLEHTVDDEWLVVDTHDEQEWYLSKKDIEMIQSLDFNLFTTIRPSEEKLIFHNFTVENINGKLNSTIPVLCGNTLFQLCKLNWNEIQTMPCSMRRDFGDNTTIPLTPENKHIVTFFGNTHKTFKYFSYYDIMQNRAHGDMEGKVFIIGSTVPGMFDIVNTSVSNNFPGVEVHASLIHSFITNTFIKRSSEVHNQFILLAVGISCGIIAYLLRPLFSAIMSMAAIFLYFLIGLTLFEVHNVWIEIVRPILTIILTYTAIMAYRYITEEKDKKFLHSTFKAYLSPELIDIMYKNKQVPQLGGEEGIRTAYFTDIQGFSTFSEKLGSPTRLVELLNEYLSAMTDILLRHFGTLDKYEGDAIIAFFGAPMPMQDHAQQACQTALDMQSKLQDLRDKWKSEGTKWPDIVKNMRMRIGINTGAITTGNMGSAVRMNYTMMGDAVNLSARLESAAKQYGVYNMISHFTYEHIKDIFEVRQLDKIMVVGKSEPVTVFELIAPKGALDQTMKNCLSLYTEGLSYFYQKQWDKALKILSQSEQLEPFRDITPGQISPSTKIMSYCQEYKHNPPPPDWEGVTKLTSK